MASLGASNDQPTSRDPPTSRDTVLRAFLFTDLVGSTAITAYLGVEAGERFRRAHFSMLQLQVDRFGGEEVKSVGDGVMAVFDSVHRALDAACAMQMSVHRVGSVAGHAVSMRVGLTVGDAVPHRGDYYGLAVNQASRLCNAAEGGEVLVSAAVTSIAAPTDHRFVDRGPASLHGLPEPVQIFELVWPRDRPRIDFPLPARITAEVPFRFVGREGAQLQLADWLEAARKGARQVVLVGGEPGIGKTAFVAQVVRLAAEAAELVVLYGACDEDLARPYGPFALAFGRVAATASPELLEELRGSVDPALFRLVPALAERLGVTVTHRSDGDGDRVLLFDAVIALLRRLGSRCPVVLVLEDLHWADPATLALLRHIARHDDLTVALVGTYRTTDIDETHPLSQTLAVLARLEGTRHLHLEGLDDDEVCSLVGAAAGHDLHSSARRFALEVGRETSGNPYFIVEILRDLAERGVVARDLDGRWHSQGNWQASLPRTVCDVIVQRVQRLGQPVLRCLGAAAVFGIEFDPMLVATAVGSSLEDVVEALDRAAGAELVAESAGVGGRLMFAHGLVQRTLYEQLGLLRRQQLHRTVAQTLEAEAEAHPHRAGGLAAELARHWLASGRVESQPQAFHWALRAGETALVSLGAEEAERWFAQAQSLLESLPEVSAAQRVRTLLLLGIAQRQGGKSAFRETLLEAGRLAQQHGENDLLVEAVLANSRGIQSSTGRGDDARLAMLDAALAASVTPPGAATAGADSKRARLLALSALERLHVASFPERYALAQEALELARRSGDDETIANVLTLRHNAIRVPSTLSVRLADTAEAMELSARGGDLLGQFWAIEHRVRAVSEVPDLAEVDRCLERCEVLADRLAQPGLRYYLAMHASWRRLLAGDLAGAEAAAGQVRIIGRATGQPETDSMYVAQLLAIRREQGRQGELESLLIKALADNPGIAALRSSVSLLHANAGRLDQAATVFGSDARSGFAEMPYNTLWSTALVQYADVAALLYDAEAAAVLWAQLAPFSGMLAHNSATCAGPIDRALGMLAAVQGRYQEAERCFRAAQEICEQAEAPLWLARTLSSWVRFLPQPAADAQARMRRVGELAAACDADGVGEELARGDIALGGR